MAGARAPSDVRCLDWAGKDAFRRVRAEWLQLHRWDAELSPATIVVLAEIAGRLAHDRDWAWPSIDRLAAELGRSAPTVKRAVSQAIERGWLIIEKRGFGGSNHYAMAFSPSVQAHVVDEHERRVVNFVATRPPALRSKMIRLGDDAIEINSDPSLRSKLIPGSDQKRSLDEINSDPLSLSQNLTSEFHHRSSEDSPANTYQDRATRESVPPSGRHSTFGSGPAHPDKSPRDELIAALGAGDPREGRLIADAIGAQRCAFLIQQIIDVGVWRAQPQIRDAAAQARAHLMPSLSQPELKP